MVLWKNSRAYFLKLMGSLVIPPSAYRPIIKSGVEIPVTNQSGKYRIDGYFSFDRSYIERHFRNNVEAPNPSVDGELNYELLIMNY